MAFQGGPLDGQPVNPDTVRQADGAGALDLKGLMAGMGGAPGGPPGAPPPGGPEPDTDDQLSDSDRMTRILGDLMKLSGPDSEWSEQDKASGQQAMSLLQKIRANEEKMHMDALGGKIQPQFLTKQFAGAGG